MLAIASVCGKVACYAQLNPDRQDRVEQHVAALLVRNHWTALGTEDLAGTYSTLRFLAPECRGDVVVAMLSPGRDAASLIEEQAQASGGRVVAYLGAERLLRHPRLAYLESRLAPMLALVGLSPVEVPPAIVLIEPANCGVEHRSFWSRLPFLASSR